MSGVGVGALLKILQGSAGNAPEAVKQLRIAGPWGHDDPDDAPGDESWARVLEFDGSRDEHPWQSEADLDDPLGETRRDEEQPTRWVAYVEGEPLSDPGEPGCDWTFHSAEEAKHAIDAILARKWVLR